MISAESPTGQPAIFLRVSVPDQRLDLLAGNAVLASYPISTSKYGLGTEPGSFRTPTGRFVIDEMIGENAPAWAEFKTRQLTGEIATPGGDEDGILTRILWLAGTEPHNANTRDRFIYIHGTNQEALIGTPASHGCVRMRNADVVDLFERVRPGTPVEIIA
jgi:lipoprotein-anchoring transpeptidase ErfK/SrfK